MKKYSPLILIMGLVSCSESSPDDLVANEPVVGLVSYEADIKSIVDSQCLSCHNDNFASGGNSYSSYIQFREAVENGEVIDRITRPVGDPQLMPQGMPLPDASINLILQWEMDGYLETE